MDPLIGLHGNSPLPPLQRDEHETSLYVQSYPAVLWAIGLQDIQINSNKMTLRNDLPAQETPESVQCSFGRAAWRWVYGQPKPTLFIPNVIDLTRRDATRSACLNSILHERDGKRSYFR